MKKDYNVSIDDNGAGYLIVINKGTSERFAVCAFNTLGDAWRHIQWMYEIESQEFTVGEKKIPVRQWLAGMMKAGYIDEKHYM